ncbi:MAG: hypothetical protein WBN06_06915 [Lysobacterales bacterium]|jgi:hypothetical protein
MHRVFKGLVTGALVLATLPVLAQTAGNDQTLVLPLSSALTVNNMARVITSKGRPADCLAPLAVNKIDGEKRVVPAQGFLIEPGVHTVNGKAMLDLTNCPLTDSNLHISSAADLEVEFEPDGTYYIGYFHEAANTEEWKLVVWHIEKSP